MVSVTVLMNVNDKPSLQQFIPVSEAEFRVSFRKFKAVLDISLPGFSLSRALNTV
jgi:hypothetical protein